MTVVIPVLNDERRLAACLSALETQSYPRDRYEVVVVDNGSKSTPSVEESGAVHLITEPRRGSYAARNRGARGRSGDALAFTDSDCIPDRHWLARGVDALARTPLVGGAVEVFASGRPTAAELYEVVMAFPQQTYVEELGFAATANLFCRREVFVRLGGFKAGLGSGGDLEFGVRARRAGHRLGYAPDAIVRHPARTSVAELNAKMDRIAAGYSDLSHRYGETPPGSTPSLYRAAKGTLRSMRLLGAPGFSGAQRVRAAAVGAYVQLRTEWLRLRFAVGARGRDVPRNEN